MWLTSIWVIRVWLRVTINIKVIFRRKIEKVVIVLLCCKTNPTSANGLEEWERSSSHAVGTLNWILNNPSLWKDMYITLTLTCLNSVSLRPICCTIATLKLFWFTDSVVEPVHLFLLWVMVWIIARTVAGSMVVWFMKDKISQIDYILRTGTDMKETNKYNDGNAEKVRNVTSEIKYEECTQRISRKLWREEII